LWSFEFIALCAISTLAFSNIAIFYGFYDYLSDIGVEPAWRGPLLSLEPLTALLVRPFFGRYLTLGNGTKFIRVGLCLATAALVSYPFATVIPVLALVRVLHGAGFVAIVAGLMGILTSFLPQNKIAQGFGLFSITILLPYAIVPPFIELLLPHLSGGHGMAYAVAAPLMLPAFLLLRPLSRKTRTMAAALPPEYRQKPTWAEVREGIASPGVTSLVVANMLLVSAHAIVFFFMRDFALGLGAANPGMFFTCANAATITLRVTGARALNRIDQGGTLVRAFFGLGVLLPLFALAGGPGILWGMAVLYGTGMGLTMPLINASMITISPPRLKAFNANLIMVAVDAGFFAGPLLGGALLAGGWTRPGLFILGGGFMATAGLLMVPVARRMRQTKAEAAA